MNQGRGGTLEIDCIQAGADAERRASGSAHWILDKRRLAFVEQDPSHTAIDGIAGIH
jgi:hypothetical protein